jgi:hypothetical protein
MKLRRKLFVIGIAAVLMLAILYVPPVGAAIGPVIIRPYHFYAPVYAPGWYYPQRYGYWARSYVVVPQTGDVKINTHLKDDAIYVDGGYAGVTGKLKKFSLRPGNHDIQVRSPAGTMLFDDRVQVLRGKTTEIKVLG